MSIKGLLPREPIGAVLTIGHKGPKGNPTETDRFFIVVPQMADGVRGLHPAFAAFNEAAPEKRQMIRGNLVHASREEMFEQNLKAQVLTKGHPVHPMKSPACVGDGTKARRWDGKEYREIACPHDLCEFRQGLVKLCKPWMRFTFQPRWPQGNPLPTPLMKLTSNSWNNASAFLGFFGYLEQQAAQLGLPVPNFYGLPFVLTLSKKSIPSQQRAFPVLSISPDTDLQAFLLTAEQRRQQLMAAPPRMALTDGEQQDPIEIAADLETITPGISVPAERIP